MTNKNIISKLKYNLFKIYNKIGGMGIFLGLVIILYLITLIINPNKFILSLNNSIKLFLSLTWIFIMIFLLMIIIDLFINKNKINKFFNKKNNLFSWFFIIIAGIISTGPIYMWYPIIGELKEKGMPIKYQVAFLYNRSIKIPLIYPMIEIFSSKVVITLLIVMIIFSIINGYIVELILNYNKKTTINNKYNNNK